MMMFKSRLALAVALGLGMSGPLWAAEGGIEARLAALEARVQAAEARAEAAESRASQAEVKASAASEQAQVANSRSQKVDEKTAGAQGFEFHGYARSGLLGNGVMPALGAATGDDGYAVAAWVYHLNGRTLPYVGQASLTTGERQFGQMCAACHGPAGTGNPMLGAPDLTDDVWIYGDSLQDIQRAVQNGLNNAMPAHGALLGEQRVRLVTAYVLSLNEMEDRR